MIKGGNIKKGNYIMFKGFPHQVTKTEFVSPGKGSAFTRAKLKHAKSGYVEEFTFKSSEPVEELDVASQEMQYLYTDADDVVFMDPRTFEQISISKKLLDDKLGYLTPDLTLYALMYEDEAIGVRFPLNVKLKVTEAEDSTAGNRVNAPKKPITLETGLVIQAPIFIKPGEIVSVDTETGEYVGRVNE